MAVQWIDELFCCNHTFLVSADISLFKEKVGQKIEAGWLMVVIRTILIHERFLHEKMAPQRKPPFERNRLSVVFVILLKVLPVPLLVAETGQQRLCVAPIDVCYVSYIRHPERWRCRWR